MAGIVAAIENTVQSVKQIHWAWTSSSGGAADDTTTAVFDGDIIGFGTVPSGSAAPTAAYDIAITDSNGLDVLFGQGIDRSATANEYVAGSLLGAVSESKLTLAVTSAGDTKEGVVVLWIR